MHEAPSNNAAAMTHVWGASTASKGDVVQDGRHSWFVAHCDELRRNGELVNLDNPLSADTEKIGMIGVFSIYRCSKTGFQFANPRLSTTGMLRHFAESDYADYFATVECTKTTRLEIAYRPLLRYLTRQCQAPASLLEVGCGSGALLEYLRDEGGYEVEGVEIAPAAVPYQRKRGLQVHQVPIERLELGRTVDIVLMWSVLDHFADPITALRASHQALSPGGLIIIGNVNIDGFDHQIMGHDSFTFRPPGRVNYYNTKALVAHLELSGLEIVDIATPGKLDVDMVRDYWRESTYRPRVPFLDSLLMDPENAAAAAEFQDFLVRRHMSGYQRILARKPVR